MTLGEKLWINRSVFEQSLYYEEMPGGREPVPTRQAAEPAVQQERQSAPAQADEPARTDSSPSRRQDPGDCAGAAGGNGAAAAAAEGRQCAGTFGRAGTPFAAVRQLDGGLAV